MSDGARRDAARLARVELFAGLGEADLAWLAATGRPVTLADGEVLFEDGQQAEHFYVLLSGELLVTKNVDGRAEVVARHSADAALRPGANRQGEEAGKPSAAHQFTGELPMLAGGAYVAAATAVGRTELLAYDLPCFLEIITRFPQVCRVLLPVLAWRIRSYEVQAGRRAMLNGLGTLAAGLAHELNNPTAVVVRAAAELQSAVGELAAALADWGRLATDVERAAVAGLAERAQGRPPGLDPFEAAVAEDEIADLLSRRAVPDAGELAALLVEGGIEAEEVAGLADRVRPCAVPAAVGSLAQTLRAQALATDVVEAGGRIALLVRDTKAYTNLDRAPERQVDLTEGIDATLAMYAARLAGVTVRRSYAPDLPLVTAYPSELNQVWANLVDNAVDAMGGRGVLEIRAGREGTCAVVEFRDDGPGIPPETLDMLFQPFFTTKDIGKGTGLGLHLSHGIVTNRHRGTIAVTSVPGDTRFVVRLPSR
jgi:signal transduction histidine kinase